MGTSSFLDELVGTKKKEEGEAKGSFLDELVSQPTVKQPPPSQPPKPESFTPKNELEERMATLFGLKPSIGEGADFDTRSVPINPSMSAMKPAQVQKVLAKPLPMPKYTGSVGEQLLTSFMGNVAEGLSRTASFGMLGGVAPTPQGITGEIPIGIAGQVAGAVPGLSLMGQAFHWGTQAIVKGLPAGMKAVTEAAIKLGFTTDMMNNALHSTVEFVDSARRGDAQGMINSGSSALIDSLFSFLIAKGLPNDAKKLADFKKGMDAADMQGIPRQQFIQSWEMKVPTTPSPELSAKADKVAYEPEIKQEVKKTNDAIVRTKNVRTKKVEEYVPFEEELFDELLRPAREETARIKDYSDYPTKEEVAKVTGKKEAEVTEEDIVDYKEDLEFFTKDIDLETGTKAPEALISEASPFRAEADVSLAQANNYKKSPIVASTYEELLNPEGSKSALITAHKLVNDFNLHLDGKLSEVEASKEFASKLAANVDDFKWQFVEEDGRLDVEGFGEFSKYVSDAAEWMSKVQKKGTGTSLYFGLPIGDAAKILGPWFSAIKRKAVEKLGNKATGALIKNTLRTGTTDKDKRFIPSDEWKNLGLEEDLVNNRVYTKDEILKMVDERTVEFKDVLLEEGLNKSLDMEYRIRDINALIRDNRDIGAERHQALLDERGLLEQQIRELDRKGTKFSSYVEPGGSNYKELFVTAPSNKVVPEHPSFEQWDIMSTSERQGYYDKVNEGKWQDGHADYSNIENPIVRLRMNDRYIGEGEYVSDPKGDFVKTKEGQIYNYEDRGPTQLMLRRQGAERVRLGNRQKVLFLEELQGPNPENQSKMPEYLRKRIREIGMKRAIKYAIDNGYDKVAWTTGEMQAKRYSLDKYITELHYGKNQDGTYWLAEPGNGTLDIVSVKGEEIGQYVGDDVARRILNGEGEEGKNKFYGERILSGLEIRNENKGLRKLYDQDLPNVVKKLGGKVESIELPRGADDRWKPATESFKYAGESVLKQDGTSEYWVIDNNTQERVAGPFKDANARDSKMATMEKGGIVVPSVSIEPFKSKAEGGFSLYSGIPVDKLISVGKGLIEYRKKLTSAKSQSFKEFAKEAKELGIAHWLNQSGNAKRVIEQAGDAAYETLQTTALARGGHPRAINEWKQARKEYRSGLSNQEKAATDALIMARRVDAVSKTPSGAKVKYPDYFSPEESKVIIDGIGSRHINGYKDLNPQEELLIRKAADAYFDWERKAVKDLYEEGLIGQQEMKDLQANDYSKFSPASKPSVEDIFDRSQLDPTGRSKNIVYDSGIEAIKKGGGASIFELNSELLMLESFDRVYNRIMINKAKRSMADFAKSNPSNDFARVENPEVVNLAKQPASKTELARSVRIKRYENKVSDYEFESLLKNKYKTTKLNNLSIPQLKELDTELGAVSKGYKTVKRTIPKGWVRDYYYEDGSKKPMYLEPKFASEWMTDTKEMSGPFGKFVRLISGTQIVKMFATGVNPVFAIANLPRDAMHAWFASRIMQDGKWDSLYSVFAPKAAPELLNDYRQVFSDVIHRRGVVNDFIEDGGGMNYLYSQGKLTDVGVGRNNKVRLETPFDKIYEFMSYINESSELLTRAAIRNRVIKTRGREQGLTYEQAKKDPKIRKEATFAAIDQMNFGEGGSFTKALDNGIPYLNARIVGTRSLWRVFQPNSGTASQSAAKLGQFAALTVGLYLLNKSRNPQAMEDLKDDPRTVSSLAIPFSKDAGVKVLGQTRYPFIRMPLDSSQSFFKVLFEGIADKMTGGSVDAEKIVKSLKNSLPADISSLPPTLQAVIGYYTNTDIWRGEEIWKSMQGTIPYKGPRWATGAEVGGSELEKIPGRTPRVYEDLGNATGLSPERLGYMIESLLTSDNVYSQITFSAYDKVFRGLDDGQRKQLLQEAMSQTSGIKRFYGLTSPAAQDVKEAKDIKQDRVAIRLEQDVKLDDLIDGYLFRKDTKSTDIARFINKQRDPLERERMEDEFKFARETKDLPNRRWWMELKRMDVQGRAEAYVARKDRARRIDTASGNRDATRQLNKEALRFGDSKGQIKGVITEEFLKRVSLLGRK